MASTPFKSLSYANHDVITRDGLNQLETNAQWLQDNTPRVHFLRSATSTTDSMLAVVSGRVYVPRDKYSHVGTVRVYFGPWFKPGTSPFITTGLISDQKKDVHVVINGIGPTAPDHRGFDVYVEAMTLSARPKKVNGHMQADTPDRYIYVSWQAIGERA